MHVMSGKARLRGKLCELSEFDTQKEMLKKCFMTTEEMFAPDPAEKVMAHVGAEQEKTNTSACKLNSEWSLFNRDRQVSCAYIIGVVGLSPYTTHFSTLLKLNEEVKHVALREGKPQNDKILENDPKFSEFPYMTQTLLS